MSDPLSLTPNEASSKLIAASNTLWSLIGDLDELERAHLKAKRVYEVAFAHAFKTAEGSVDQRKYAATIETEYERELMDTAYADHRKLLEQVRWTRSAMDAWRTISASVRDEWKATASA